MKFATVAILDHPKKPETVKVAGEIEAALKQLGVKTHRANVWDTQTLERLVAQVQLVIVLGGDGSTLRAARVSAPHNVPVTSVNFGRLGFLSEMTVENWREVLPRLIGGDYWVEERMMLTAHVIRKDGHKSVAAQEALNDVVIGRGTLARIVHTRIFVDGSPLTTVACDGLIISTATGSTAYALAVGGPILPPSLRNIILVPIAPHLSLDIPIVLSQGSIVEVEVGTDHTAGMTSDGQKEVALQDGDRVVVHASHNVARFARCQPQDYFYRTLMRRLIRTDALN